MQTTLLRSLSHDQPSTNQASADPKYCRHCFPSFEIPHIDALNARQTGEWYPFTDLAYGQRWQVHASKAEVAFCGEREAGDAFARAIKEEAIRVNRVPL
jgi:hypothetical protein